VEEALKGIVEQAAGGITSGGLKNCAIKRAGLRHWEIRSNLHRGLGLLKTIFGDQADRMGGEIAIVEVLLMLEGDHACLAFPDRQGILRDARPSERAS
jgi:hypothetical protein